MQIGGRYRLEREIARGGMGAVWLGEDEVLGRQVALKRIGLMPGTTTPDVERATREARLAAALNHPHVVAIYDQVDAGDEHWLVMEYVEGSTLAELVRRDGPMTPDEVAPLLRQAAEALAAAHAARIVHRDVKPSNLLVGTDGQVKLTDFGIARMEADATLTQTGLMTGSPAYLAPEIASGQVATEAADVWSLGATLFHALDGRPPYDVSGNLMAALYRLVNEEPPRLAQAGWLAPLLEATMVRDPEQRWPMSRVAAFLARVVEDTAFFTPVPVPAPAADPQGGSPVDSRVDSRVDTEEPVASEHPTATVEQPAAPAAAPVSRRRRRPGVGLLAAAGALLLATVLVVAFTWDRDPAATTPPDDEASSQSSSSPTGEESSDDPPTRAEAMETFVEDYLALVTSDRRTAWQQLTPTFQEQSGGFGSYQRWWRTISDAEITRIEADPETGTVDYTVRYTRADGGNVTDDVRLQLVPSGDGFLIAAEG